MFSKYGEVMDCYIPKDHATGQSRGFGFIRFATEEEAEAAIQGCDHRELAGRELRVQVAQHSRPPIQPRYPGPPPQRGGYDDRRDRYDDRRRDDRRDDRRDRRDDRDRRDRDRRDRDRRRRDESDSEDDRRDRRFLSAVVPVSVTAESLDQHSSGTLSLPCLNADLILIHSNVCASLSPPSQEEARGQ